MNSFFQRTLSIDDSVITDAVARELHRQENQIELIASENIASPAVMAAQGTVFTNKYAEGYPAIVITAAANTPTWSKRLPSLARSASQPTSI